MFVFNHEECRCLKMGPDYSAVGFNHSKVSSPNCEGWFKYKIRPFHELSFMENATLLYLANDNLQQLLMTYKWLGVVVRCIFPTRPLCPPFSVTLVIEWGHWNLISTFLPMNWKACCLYGISNELWRYVIWLEVNRYDNQTMSPYAYCKWK